MKCKEYESPTRTVHAAVEKMTFERIHRTVPDLWDDDIDIYAKVDVIADKLDIDIEYVPKHIGVAKEVYDITRKCVYGEWSDIQKDIDWAIKEFSERTFIKMGKTE
jgi:hypothetical protein